MTDKADKELADAWAAFGSLSPEKREMLAKAVETAELGALLQDLLAYLRKRPADLKATKLARRLGEVVEARGKTPEEREKP